MRQPELRSAFTLIELLVVMAVIGILIALLLPAVNMVRASARAADCQNRMANIGKGFLSYEATFNTKVSPGGWQAEVGPHIEDNTSVFVCPDRKEGESTSYGINNLSNWFGNGDSGRVLVVESNADPIDIAGAAADPTVVADVLSDRHADSMNVIFGGGNVQRRTIEDIDPTDATLLADLWWPQLKPGP